MNKTNFFTLMNTIKKNREGTTFRVQAFAEDAAEYARLVAADPKYPWVQFSTNVVVNECWHINVVRHRSAEAMEKMVRKATRWLAEWMDAQAIHDRAMLVAHNEALIVNEAYDEQPECPNGNRLTNAVESVFGRSEAYSWVKEAGEKPSDPAPEPFTPVVYVDADCVKYDYTEIDGYGEIARYDANGEWFLVCNVCIDNPVPESISIRLPHVVKESEDRVIAIQIDGADGVKYEYSEDIGGCSQISELIGNEWHFVCYPNNISVPTPAAIWEAVPKSAQEPWGKFTLTIGRREYTGFTSATAARDAHNQLRDDSGEGASTWPRASISDGEKRVYLSYNGRAWATAEYIPDAAEIDLTKWEAL